MFRRNKLLSLLLLLSLLAICLPNVALAHEHRLESLDIEVMLLEDGSAIIRERRVAHLVEGTENYIVIENLGESEIYSFTVLEDDRVYEYIDNWNINASREEKSYKNGIIETSSGYELAWGIGEYGHHDYLLEYRVTNFIKQLEDSQILFWQFVNAQTNIPPQKVTVTIKSQEHHFSQDDEAIWAFGFPGEIRFQDGSIVAESSSPLSSRDYVTILTRFNDGMFATEDYIDRSFDEIRERAFEGSDYDSDGSSDFGNPLKFIIPVIGFIFPLLILLVSLTARNTQKKPRSFRRRYKEEYYRDLPYKGDFINSYHILYDMGVSNFERILTAFILKWIKEERIQIIKNEKGLIRKREVTNLRLSHMAMENDSLEEELYRMLLDASGPNQILEEDEFTKWARSNYRKLEDWEDKAKVASSFTLQNEGYLKLIEKKKFIFFKDYDIELTNKGKDLEANVYKFVNYLHDFSLLNEHEAINVTLWDEIMIWAAILGLTKKVRDEFIKLYPNYEHETIYTGNTVFIASNLSRKVSSARTQATRSSGGGGTTSFGGGGGSFGGGTGGGTR